VGTAVTIQRMVFGNAGGNSGAGVGFTRDPSTGENRLYLDWLPRAQGEDIVSGRCRVTPEAEVPRWLLQRLADVSESLEKSFGDAQEFEFTVENGVLFMLQTRHAKRTPMAALRIAVEQMESGMLGPGDALRRLDAIDLDSIASNRVESDAPPIGRAVPAGIGVASGPAAFTRDAVEACAKHGTPAIFVRNDIATGDIAGIALAGGVLTAGGSRTSHAAVVARQMGKVCLVGCAGLAVDERARHATLGDAAICEGDPLCIDGSTGDIFTGTPRVVSERPVALIKRLKEWRHNAA
jgi:pyruvate,orthophosphate dikinase